MKVIIENEANGPFNVSFCVGSEQITTTITCASVRRACFLAWNSLKGADGMVIFCNGQEVASGFGIPGMNHIEFVNV